MKHLVQLHIQLGAKAQFTSDWKLKFHFDEVKTSRPTKVRFDFLQTNKHRESKETDLSESTSKTCSSFTFNL